MCQLYISMETFKKIGPYFVYTIGLYSLFSGGVSAFLLQPSSEICTADSSQECGEWSVVRMDPVCVLLRRRNCSKDHSNISEFKFCKDIVQWGEWAPSGCTITNNGCFISRIRSCSVPSLKTCDSNETNADIKYWVDMSTCPCRTDKSNWLEWSAWECHDNLGCLMVRRRMCPHINGCAGDSYELDTCKVDRCDRFVTWNTWGEWNCNTGGKLCVRYKHRSCSSGHDIDCQMIGGSPWNMKPCEDTCNPSTTPNLHRTTYFTKASAMTKQTTSDITSTSSLSTAPTAISATSQTSVLTTLRISTATWSEWGNWTCRMGDRGTCNMTRTRICSTGTAEYCGTVSKMTKPCDQNICPDKIRLQTSGQCKDYFSVGPACPDNHRCEVITDVFHPICQVTDMASKNCPKACGCCDVK